MAEDRYYLTVGPDAKSGKFLAVLSLGSPQVGDEHVEILTLEIVKDQAEAETWMARMLVERPWEERN